MANTDPIATPDTTTSLEERVATLEKNVSNLQIQSILGLAMIVMVFVGVLVVYKEKK